MNGGQVEEKSFEERTDACYTADPCLAGEPADHIFGILSVLHRSTYLFMKREMKRAGIDCAPPYLLLIGSSEGMSQDDLAARMRIDKGTVAKTVKAMEQNGYIIRRQDEKDRRRNGLYLTEKGRQAIPVIRQHKTDYESVLTQNMSAEERSQFYALAHRAASNLVESLTKESPCNVPEAADAGDGGAGENTFTDGGAGENTATDGGAEANSCGKGGERA